MSNLFERLPDCSIIINWNIRISRFCIYYILFSADILPTILAADCHMKKKNFHKSLSDVLLTKFSIKTIITQNTCFARWSVRRNIQHRTTNNVVKIEWYNRTVCIQRQPALHTCLICGMQTKLSTNRIWAKWLFGWHSRKEEGEDDK